MRERERGGREGGILSQTVGRTGRSCMGGSRERETDRQTDRQTDRDTERDRALVGYRNRGCFVCFVCLLLLLLLLFPFSCHLGSLAPSRFPPVNVVKVCRSTNSSAIVIQFVFNVCRYDFSCGNLNCSDHNCTYSVIIILSLWPVNSIT